MRNDCEWINEYIIKNKLPFDVFTELTNLHDGQNSVSKLVGMFPDQYSLDIEQCPFFCEHVLKISDVFLQRTFKTPVFIEILENVPAGVNVYLHDLWINRMYSGSYNRLHRHSGALSFIIFVDVPYTMEDQVKSEPYIDDPEKVVNGCTEFLDPFSQASYLLKVEKGIEGNMYIFPSWMRHVVYPFKNVDGARVTISGNLNFDYRELI